MKAPIKPGSEASKKQEGGSLGNIDELTGDPGKGTGGPSLRPEESGSDAHLRPNIASDAEPATVQDHASGEEKSLYERLAEKDATPVGRGGGT